MSRGDRDRQYPLGCPGRMGDDATMMALIDNSAASAEVRPIYDGTRKTRGADWIIDFWRALATAPAMLKRSSCGCGSGRRLPSYRRFRWDQPIEPRRQDRRLEPV
jgi:hypothetical protein